MKRTKLKILIICACFLLAMLLAGYTAIEASFDAEDIRIVPVYREGIRVCDGLLIKETTYTQLRAFSEGIKEKLEITWDGVKQIAYVRADGLEIIAPVGQKYIIANGRYLFAQEGVLVYEGSVIVPIRALAKAFNVEITWDEETSSVSLGLEDIKYIESGDAFYNEEDLYWLSRIIHSESGNQPLEGQMGVGNVVMNRYNLPEFPDSIYGVIFDNRYGVQFSVTTAGTIYHTPDEDAIIAAKLCLEGYSVVGDALYFVNPAIGASSWFSETRTYVATIEDHAFYA
jgi:N-acetylmuramoyl-L-alanine amidase